MCVCNVRVICACLNARPVVYDETLGVCGWCVLIILNDCTFILYLEFPRRIFVSVNMCMCTLLSLMIALWRVHAHHMLFSMLVLWGF